MALVFRWRDAVDPAEAAWGYYRDSTKLNIVRTGRRATVWGNGPDNLRWLMTVAGESTAEVKALSDEVLLDLVCAHYAGR